MLTAKLEFSSNIYSEIRSHLVRSNPKSEEAAFCFASQINADKFKVLEWRAVALNEFAYRSLFHIELTDECRASVIKRAHDLNACLIEFHSHPLADRAYFSESDRAGFTEFVPHVWWRLKAKPYGAIVMAPTTFDSLIWSHEPTEPNGVLAFAVGEDILKPTGISIMGEGEYVAREL